MAGLFSDITIKDLKSKNRIVMPPMCMYSAKDDGFANDWHLTHYETRAIGGVGLIIVEATAVEPRGRISDRDLGIWSDDQIEGLKRITEKVHANGCKIALQLAHAGRKCAIETERIISPSALRFNEEYQEPKAMTIQEIEDVVEAFRQASRRAREAGFDAVEIHGAHGYLINQFLSPLTNRRIDEYGGTLEKRARFLKEVIGAVRESWEKEKPVFLRVSAEEYRKDGYHPADLVEVVNHVQSLGIDLIHVSSGGVVPASVSAFPGYQLPFAEKIKKETKLPVIAGGMVVKAEMAEEIIRNKRADFVFLGRELLRNPYWSLQAAHILGIDIPWPEQYERSK